MGIGGYKCGQILVCPSLVFLRLSPVLYGCPLSDYLEALPESLSLHPRAALLNVFLSFWAKKTVSVVTPLSTVLHSLWQRQKDDTGKL